MRTRGLFLAIGLLVIVNAIVLAGVRYNRSGAPDSMMTLTERELPIAYTYQKENSGISLMLQTSHYYYGGTASFSDDPFPWFDRNKLAAIGFDVSTQPAAGDQYDFYSRQLPRRAYAVLEYDGPAWEAWQKKLNDALDGLERAGKEGGKAPQVRENEQKNLERALRTDSHLFIIDAGIDAATLRRQYPDQKKYLILPAKVRISYVNYGVAKNTVRGYVEILTQEINVPHRLHSRLGEWRRQGSPFGITAARLEGAPRYQVVLHTGRRYEPWIEDVLVMQ